MKKQWKNENQRRWYLKHREEICAKKRAEYARKKALKNEMKDWAERGWITLKTPKNEVFTQVPKI